MENNKQKGNTMTTDFRRELTHTETIVDTNEKGQQLCRPKYGHRWTICEPITPMSALSPRVLCHWIGDEVAIKAQWNANYRDSFEPPVELDGGGVTW